jgi:hypothetical protein
LCLKAREFVLDERSAAAPTEAPAAHSAMPLRMLPRGIRPSAGNG